VREKRLCDVTTEEGVVITKQLRDDVEILVLVGICHQRRHHILRLRCGGVILTATEEDDRSVGSEQRQESILVDDTAESRGIGVEKVVSIGFTEIVSLRGESERAKWSRTATLAMRQWTALALVPYTMM
jgi:hypothetical protein